MKRSLPSLFSLAFLIATCLTSCGDGDGLGACSISCGGSGTGQPFTFTQIAFINENDCRKRGEEKGGGCKASYCPPTGDSNDCYQVYP